MDYLLTTVAVFLSVSATSTSTMNLAKEATVTEESGIGTNYLEITAVVGLVLLTVLETRVALEAAHLFSTILGRAHWVLCGCALFTHTSWFKQNAEVR